MTRRLRVYTASKLKEAARWSALVEAWPEVEFTARWVWGHVGVTPDLPAFAKVFWSHDDEDVRTSDVLLLYAEPGDHLRGGLVEAGMAIAYGLEVVVVGDHPDYGTWQHHAQVHRVASLTQARELLRAMAVRNEWEIEP